MLGETTSPTFGRHKEMRSLRTMTPRFSQKQIGIFLMCASALFFAFMQITIKVSAPQVPLMEQVFFRNLISLAMAYVTLRNQKVSYWGEKKHQPLLFTRSILGFVGLISMFYAVSHANQGDVTTIIKLSPFLVTILGAIFLKEKIRKFHVVSLIFAFAGALFVANPAWTSHLFPLSIAFICAVMSSITYTLLAYFKDKVHGMTIIFHFSAISVIASMPFLFFQFVVPDFITLIKLLLIGVFGTLGQITMTYAYRKAPAGEISIYQYSGIIFSILLGYGFLGETLQWNSYVGIALVIVASFIVYIFSLSNRKK